MTTKTPTKPKRKKAVQPVETKVFVSPTALKRTFVMDKRTGKMVDATPPQIAARLPKRTTRPIGVPNIAPPGNYPMLSDASSVHPKQVAALNRLLVRKGLPPAAQKDGRIRFESAQERKAICEARGFGDRNGGYKDPQFRRS